LFSGTMGAAILNYLLLVLVVVANADSTVENKLIERSRAARKMEDATQFTQLVDTLTDKDHPYHKEALTQTAAKLAEADEFACGGVCIAGAVLAALETANHGVNLHKNLS